MESLKLKRKSLRQSFTITLNSVKEEFKKVEIDHEKLRELNSYLLDKFSRLEEIQEKISELLLETGTEDEYSEDFETAENYRENYLSFKSKIDNYEDVGSEQSFKSLSNRKLCLPKLELHKFNGDIKSWLGFWSQFSRIHEDNELEPEDKFQYLIQTMTPGSRAASLIESFPPTAKNYPKAIELLKERFGREDLQVQVYVRELLKLVMKNAVNGRKCSDLTTLYDHLETHLRALDTLGRSQEKFADFLAPLVESCLPEDVLRTWERSRISTDKEDENPGSERTLKKLMDFLRQEVNGEEMINLARSGFGPQIKIKKESVDPVKNEFPSASALVSSTSQRMKCVFCDNSHLSQDCGKAATLTRDEKKTAVMQKGLCLICLKYGHLAKKCRSNVRCIICSKRHYAILCPDLIHHGKPVPLKKDENTNTTALFAKPTSTEIIYLKTLFINLRHQGRIMHVRALLDDGSHRSYIEGNLAKELRLSPMGKEILSQGLFGGQQTPEYEHNRYCITVESLDGRSNCQISVLDQPKICTTLPRIRDKTLLSELERHGIILSDVGNETPPIRLLLGADVLGEILTGRIEILKSGISAIETKLGWCILGTKKKSSVVSMVTMCMHNFEIPKMWDLENLGITDPTERKTTKLLEEDTLHHFQETVRVNEYHRYEVALPWLAGHPPIYDNYDVAEYRLRSVTKRLIKENLFEAYNDVFNQWKNDGIIETVPENEIVDKSHYLPHRPVIKPSSTTTKIRPVFDASFKRPGYASLNECLSVGPSLSQQIPPLLLRFRMNAVGVIADIKQAFLQVSVRQEDRNVMRFLWWNNEDQTKLQFFRHCRVVFGVSSSPFLLNATIRHHLSNTKFQAEDTQATIDKLKQGFYVDNLTTSVDNEDLLLFKAQSIDIMKQGCFELREWAYNGIENSENHMVLGLNWNSTIDEISCVGTSTEHISGEAITKRKLLSVINSIYYPIGFTSPATLLPKLLLQEAWCKKLEWDEELPINMQQRYKKWIEGIHLVPQCAISRRIFQGKHENATLHIFTDASANSYACCAYIRCEENSVTTVRFVSAKAKVAPMHRPTIPRLELLGATIGARLAVSILDALQISLKTTFWTDSMIVLGWITNDAPWNTFVGNRVKEIRQISNVENWRHVPGEMNPADLPSRSCTWVELLQKRWWEGPTWLYQPESSWPHAAIILPEEAKEELRKTVATTINIISSEQDFAERFLYFSNYIKIIRMTAWMLRFCNNSTKNRPKHSDELSYEEMEKSELALIRIIQSEWSSKERDNYSKSIQFYEENGILKVQTRLILSDDEKDFQRPTVLPDHLVVRRMIEHYHKKLNHGGVQVTLSKIRERFWIPRGRRVVREVIGKCVICKRHSSKPVVPVQSPLPVDRVNRVSAFQVTGADLTGPVFLRGGSKAWIVLFTCAVYRAIHLELVSSLSTEAFMQALRRFFARRGRCSTMYTDNGTNFLGTSRALSINWNEIQDECALLKIKWNFSPPTAPWYGGWWERMVSSTKQLLKKSLGRALVTYEEMLTILCDCEATINNRPLTYISDDPNELQPLKPAHFIQDIKENSTTDLDTVDSKHLLKRVRYVQTLRDKLRKRFQEEYLGELIRCPQLNKRRKDLSVGDIVIIGSDNSKRLNWPLGRVIEIFPGKDKIGRVVKLRVGNNEIIRPMQRLYPLEICHNEIVSDKPVNYSRYGRPIVPLKRLNL